MKCYVWRIKLPSEKDKQRGWLTNKRNIEQKKEKELEREWELQQKCDIKREGEMKKRVIIQDLTKSRALKKIIKNDDWEERQNRWWRRKGSLD